MSNTISEWHGEFLRILSKTVNTTTYMKIVDDTDLIAQAFDLGLSPAKGVEYAMQWFKD